MSGLYKGLMGINVRTLGVNRDNTLAYIRSLQPAFTLAHDDPQLAAGAQALGSRAIYRQSGDEDININPSAFISERARNAPTAAYIHTFNEITPSAALANQEIECMKVAESVGRKCCIINAATNKSAAEWDAMRPAIERAVRNGHAIGAHVYLDGTHDEGAFEWVPLMRQYRGTWIVTEFGYIKSIFDANTGWRNSLSAAGYGGWFHAIVWRMRQYNAPLLVFSYDHWRQDDHGRNNGFGFAEDSAVTEALMEINKAHKWNAAEAGLPEPTWEKRRIVLAGDQCNIRAQPTTASTARVFRDNGFVIEYATNRDTADAGNPSLTWQMVRINGEVGWVRTDAATLAILEPPAPPPPVVTPPGVFVTLPETAFGTREEALRHAEALEGYARAIRAQAK